MSDSAQNGQNKALKSKLAAGEEEVLSFWKENKIFEKTLGKDSPEGDFIFYEGPPTANGRPGIHHLLSRAFKDIISRYKTMRGYHVARRAGWDTHGLPVELEVEKKLGLKSKKEIEEYGIAEFNEMCKQSVHTYIDEWEKFTDRIGYWVDQENAYLTYKPEYIETLWWIIKQIDDEGLLYKDYKVVPWCPRCGTALSSHELAQGYADVKDLSIYAKFKVKESERLGLKGDVYLIAWTTTPWTLPGNIALAVGKDIEYLVLRKMDPTNPEAIIVSKKTFIHKKEDFEGYSIQVGFKKEREEGMLKGKDLVGLEYEPLFPYVKELAPDSEKGKLERAWKVYEADFVTTEDGTGIVHTAVMYGQDDFELGTKEGLPKVHLVGEDGKFLSGTGEFAGMFVKSEETDVAVIKYLHANGNLFKKEKYEHSYPHCWRCKTPLIYYARDSWYVAMSKLRDRLVKENEKINWEPAHIKEGRFGEWIREVKDWAFSRERYWGTPLPVWMSEDGGEKLVVDSIETLKKHTKKSGNKYFVMRHGESDRNVANIVSADDSVPASLTERGKEEIKETVKKLNKEKIDYIFASPLMRTRETATQIAEELGLPQENIIFDVRIKEINSGVMNGKSVEEYHSLFSSYEEYFIKAPEGGETLTDVKRRVGEFLYELERKYTDKKILVVSHEYPIWMALAISEGAGLTKTIEIKESAGEDVINTGEVRELSFVSLPHDRDFNLDLHRPYIDEVVLEKGGKELRRVKEVVDVWFDSGAMPFAQSHYPFENKKWVDGRGYPADYITEAIDQTRGWFYTLHAVGNLLGRGRAYKNVICLGHILDAEGKKMSKSIGNVVNPWEMADKYGVDVLRFWMYSINQAGESKNFDEKTVDEVVKKVSNLLLNSLSFYEMFRGDFEYSENFKPGNVLDKWIIAKLNELARTVSSGLDEYRLLEPSRAIRDFIADLSQWYIRRSRDRFKGEDQEDRESALSTTHYILLNLSKIMAPFMPFMSETVYRKLRNIADPESVHLAQWPSAVAASAGEVIVLEKMAQVRKLASFGLEARARAGIKVRQPLFSVTLASEDLQGLPEYIEILKDELNVKEVLFDTSLSEEAQLNENLTPELVEEGNVRELVRVVQSLRKENNLNPSDKINLFWSGDELAGKLIEKNRDALMKLLNITELKKEDSTTSPVPLQGAELNVSIERV